MAGYSRFWEDGYVRWDRSPSVNHAPPFVTDFDINDVLTVSLVGCDIKTDVKGQSMIVIHDGVVFRQIEISGIANWHTADNIITFDLDGSSPLTLVFANPFQASKADYRIFLIVNGADIQGCDDETYFMCTSPTQVNLTFE